MRSRLYLTIDQQYLAIVKWPLSLECHTVSSAGRNRDTDRREESQRGIEVEFHWQLPTPMTTSLWTVPCGTRWWMPHFPLASEMYICMGQSFSSIILSKFGKKCNISRPFCAYKSVINEAPGVSKSFMTPINNCWQIYSRGILVLQETKLIPLSIWAQWLHDGNDASGGEWGSTVKGWTRGKMWGGGTKPQTNKKRVWQR